MVMGAKEPEADCHEVGAVVLILLNPSSSWSWMVTTLNVVTAAVIFFAIGGAAIRLFPYLKNHCTSRPWMILFTIVAILAAVLVLLNPSSILFTIGSLAAITLKSVIMARVILFATGGYAAALVFILVAVLVGPFLPVKDLPKQEKKAARQAMEPRSDSIGRLVPHITVELVLQRTRPLSCTQPHRLTF